MLSTHTLIAFQIARQNDNFRRHPGADWMVSSGLDAKGPLFVLAAVNTVRNFNAFAVDNDPHGEHDFGAFDLCGERLCWRIDYYDEDLRLGSADPANPLVTRRIITVMLASEY